MSEVLLEMKNVNKYFPGVHALKDVNFDLKSGEVHALLGENGAGKSTLIKVLGGIYNIDEGEIYIQGEKRCIDSVQAAKNLGICIIHQELVLVPYLTVAENIFLGREFSDRFRFLDKEKIFEEAQKLLEKYGMDVSPKALVASLTIAQQQMIEIIKSITDSTKILVMDEPTSSLSEKEVQSMFATIRSLQKRGVGIIYISHRMSELFEISDRISILRDGQYIGTRVTKETNEDELVNMMVGRNLCSYYTRTYHDTTEDDIILKVEHLSHKGVFHDVNFSVRKGEILGFSGLVGAGRSEVMRCVFGIDQYDEGDIFINGKKVVIKNPNDAMAHGIALVPEDRKNEGLFLVESVRYNVSFRVMEQFIKGCTVNNKVESKIVDSYIKDLTIKTPSARQKVKNLSGGNQQKIVIAKWLATRPKVLILDEPTRGVDVVAKSEIYSIINELTAQGVAIIMVSSELPEIINMCDRVVIMSKGSVTGHLDKETLTQEKIMRCAIGGNVNVG
ncbi:sugar ABC transporter ATP-binding protein [Ethanoligenens sp.]|uniref:sugar ABC transporter ATP-binding protein n=1 Tax=Ethanoligenens sp. TaxID=2099655 RepID=UPI0039E7D6E7